MLSSEDKVIGIQSGQGGRAGQAAMNPVENSPKPCRNSLRTLWKISEPCKEQKMY